MDYRRQIELLTNSHTKNMYDRVLIILHRHLGYERVYLPLHKVADTPFHIQERDIVWRTQLSRRQASIFLA